MNNKINTSDFDFYLKPITTVAHSNIALVKYWGKRSVEKNLPAVGSVSLTLDSLKTTTQFAFDSSLNRDNIELNEQALTGRDAERITDFINTVCNAKKRPYANVSSQNNFPTAAGLASSASGFAALALAVTESISSEFSKKDISILARMGSGSAARSIYGGFVEMVKGNDNSGEGDYALQLYDERYWNLRLLIAITSSEKKDISSTDGMNRTANTSPFYTHWISSYPDDIRVIKQALADKDFQKLGEVSEHSCFKMHGLALSARPPLLFWNKITTEIIHTIWNLRKKGFEAYITIDAGPQVKILCQPETIPVIKEVIGAVDGVKTIIEAKPGPDAHTIP